MLASPPVFSASLLASTSSAAPPSTSSSSSSRGLALSLRAGFLRSWQLAVQSVATDRRDEWATDINADYTMGEVLSSGHFGMVLAALGRDFTFGGSASAQPRACVVKVIYLSRRFDRTLEECKGDEEKFVRRIEAFSQRLATELYILNRCRHENILHSHAVCVAGGDLHIVLPRLYSLESLIEKYRCRYNGESMPARLIMMIVRQICIALDFLLRVGIVHRDIQAEYIYVTRGGTVKLGHFCSARLLEGGECVTPVGRKEYMCFEKQFNLYTAQSRSECLEYDGAADIWSLGVIVLRMVSYFPNEKWHRLQPDFATLMHAENMPFKWMTAEMMQLRVRLAKCGGSEDLRGWLSDRVLTVDASRRATAAELLETPTLKRLCHEDVEADKKWLSRQLILSLDWPNRLKLESNRPNYDALESKDIPAEFYWDEFDSWKELEQAGFGYEVCVVEEAVEGERKTSVDGTFLFSRAHELLSSLWRAVTRNSLSSLDLLLVDHHIRENAFIALRNRINKKAAPKTPEVTFSLPETLSASHRLATVTVHIVAIRE